MSKTYWNSEKNTDQTRNEFCELSKKDSEETRRKIVLSSIRRKGQSSQK